MSDAEEKRAQHHVQQEFLTTKTVGNKEVWNNLEDWKPSIQKEHDQLVHQKKAVIQVSREQLRRLASEKKVPIELLPGKTVHTRKAVSGAFRTRAVICGNYETTDPADDRYASGADANQIRAAVRTAATMGWQVAATDIRVAFLNAPKRDTSKLTACEIPSVFKKVGLAAEDDVWIVQMALYGLGSSPKDWSIHRDKTLPTLRWEREEEGRQWIGALVPSGDDNVWRMIEVDNKVEEHRWVGVMTVYVDDLMFAAEKEVVDLVYAAISGVWALSDLEVASDETPVKYCGFEIYEDGQHDGFHLNQCMYEKEILKKWEVGSPIEYPNCRVAEEDEVQQQDVCPEDVKRAQGIAGSLLWLATRTRPDLSVGVATMCRLVTRNPRKAVEIGQSMLRYIKHQKGGLHYPRGPLHGPWGARGQLKVERHEKLLEVCSDISYGAGSGFRSVQGIVILLSGAPIAWSCSQQPFVTHSTAEAELVAYCESLVAGRAMEAMLCMMYGESLNNNEFQRLIYGDNVAAIGLGNGNANTSWRTRHLRIRSAVLREALEGTSSIPGGVWQLLHLRGNELIADGFTKSLQGPAFDRFLQDLGMTKEKKIQRSESSISDGHGGAHQAVLALTVGCALLSQA